MKHSQNKTHWIYKSSKFTACLTVIASLGFCQAEAAAEDSFEINISSSALYLAALGTGDAATAEAVAKQEMCDNPNNRIQARNRPSIMVTNTSDPLTGGDITSFSLRISEANYLFGTGDGGSFDNFNGQPVVFSAYNMPGISITSAVITDVTGEGAEDGTDKLLTVNFTGLAPGEMAIFSIDLDTSDPNEFALPDFRSVLFGADVGEGFTNPAYYAANFTNGSVAEQQFDLVTDPIVYTGQDVRPYHAMDPIDNYGGGGTVPEPSTLVLLASAMAMLSKVRRTR